MGCNYSQRTQWYSQYQGHYRCHPLSNWQMLYIHRFGSYVLFSAYLNSISAGVGLPLCRPTTHLYLAILGYLDSFAITHSLCGQDGSCSRLSPGTQKWYHIDATLLIWHITNIQLQKGTREKGRVITTHVEQGPTCSANSWALFGQMRAALSLTLSRNNDWPS